MAKMYGRITEFPEGRGTSKPDFKGSLKVGGFTGNNAEEKNRDCALWLKNVLEEFQNNGETWVSLALWKREDNNTGEPYLSICLEDNSWKSESNSKGNVGNSKKPATTGDGDPFSL